MENIVLETSLNPIVEITDVGGDLRITGWEQPQFVADSNDDDEDSLSFDRDGDRLQLHANSDVVIRLPHGAQVSVRTVGGDAKILKLSEQKLAIGNVGGDLTLRQVAGANVGVVGGDMTLKRATGDVQVGNVGGDLEAREVDGAFKSGNVGGDLFLQQIGGAIQAIAGGDLTLSVAFKPEQEYSLQAGGDLTCRVGPDASVRLVLTAGGDISIGVPTAQMTGNSNRKAVTLGAGAAAANLRAGGDLQLTGGGFEADIMADFEEKFGEDFESQIESQIESHLSTHMADFDKLMDERMSSLNFVTNAADAAKIAATARQAAERVQRAGRQQADADRRRAEKEAERARRLAESAQRRAEAINREHGRRGWPFRGEPPRTPTPPRPSAPSTPSAPAEPVSDEERMMILRMVEQGKITVADAEKLLAALENK